MHAKSHHEPRTGELGPAKTKALLRARSIGTKVTHSEYTALERCAAAEQRTVSEWCREALLEAAQRSAGTPAEHALLGELLALRSILLNLFFHLAQGEKISSERIDEVITRADAGKLGKARTRLETIASGSAEVAQ